MASSPPPPWNGDDAWRRRPVSPFFRIVNPELYMKPNLRVGILGTCLFVLVAGSLAWQKHSYEKQQALLKNPPQPIERIIRETD
jgi:hypothetical protein